MSEMSTMLLSIFLCVKEQVEVENLNEIKKMCEQASSSAANNFSCIFLVVEISGWKKKQKKFKGI